MDKASVLRTALGEVLRSLRVSCRLSQERLAERAAVHRTYIGQVERGERNPTILTLSRILRACGVTWSEFGEAFDNRLKEP